MDFCQKGGVIDLKEITPEIARKAKLIIVSYPNNPGFQCSSPFVLSGFGGICPKVPDHRASRQYLQRYHF